MFFPLIALVPPVKLFLSVAGVVVNRTIKAVRGEVLSVTCHALGSSPAANLSWRINHESIKYKARSYTKNTKNEEGTFDSTSTLQFHPEGKDELVECVSTLGGSGAEKVVRGILIFYGERLKTCGE